MHDAIIPLRDYRPDPVPVPLRDAACAVARDCGYDPRGEFLLEARVTGVRWVVAASESVIVAAQVALAGEVFTHGLGPEYNWLHWEESPASGPVPPPDHSDSLCDLIRGPWRHSVLEAFGSDGEARIERVHPTLRGAVAEVIGASR